MEVAKCTLTRKLEENLHVEKYLGEGPTTSSGDQERPSDGGSFHPDGGQVDRTTDGREIVL